MGTRHLVCVKLDNEYKVSQFGSMGGYPDGAGVRCIKAIEDIIKNLEGFKQRVRMVELVEFEEDNQIDDVTMVLPAAKVIELINTTDEKVKLYNNIDYTGSSSCDWVYVLDLDENQFHVYEGHNRDKSKEAPEFAKYVDERSKNRAVTKIESYDIFNLPEAKDFIYFYQEKEINEAKSRGEF